ncbi:Thiamine biosynthesis lipoprotein ApbE precursor [Bremerella volcania]|uniref:FAD:protein FMN transferase n=1 Tax=Bremerella volcania TaxID=2527984 RepID=A0A518C3I1_9BACT|nr:FAD:protein FMN transferase [Bremerella volcania]QDU73775.1 Thiamine biosynthesis lipoprotein ApbE precursor [Bremerella volcania]
MQSYTTASLLWLAVFLGCQQVAPPDPIATIQGQTMGTTYHIRAVTGPEGPQRLIKIQERVDELLAQVNHQMSTYDPESELSRFNQAPAGEWFPVSSQLIEVVDAARQISDATDGAFDVTVGPSVNLWRFGPDKKRKEFPTDQEIAQASKLVGYQQVEIQSDPPALRKAQDDVYVDLSAIAKGYGVDAVYELIKAEGFTDFMVEIGGEVRATGLKPNGDPWKIGIETPADDVRQYDLVVGLHDRALATSGDYRNFFKHDGKRYSHTINPKTGRPVEHDLASVSVLFENCMLADGYATAFLVLGPVEGYNFAQEHNLPVFFQMRKEDGTVETKATTAWQQYQSN